MDASAKVVERSGALASLIGVDMNTAFALEHEGSDGAYDPYPLAPVEDLLAGLRQRHPALRGAYAELLAQEAGRDAIKHAWGPSVSLVGDVSRGARSSGSVAAERARSSASIGIQISIPLYDGGLRKHRTMEADALVDLARAKMVASERSLYARIWQSHRVLRSLSQSHAVEIRLHDDARRSYGIARGRYQEGVGSIEELISAQSVLADAEHTITASRARWNLAKLTLAAGLGQLDADGISTLASVTPYRPTPEERPPASPPLLDRESGTDAHHPNTRR
ncbi:MAG: TolC family protein [Pandoraea sp.]|nr:TolC family protein [Pandoraea sp.]